MSGITIAFVDGSDGSDTITDSASGFNFEDGFVVQITKALANDNIEKVSFL